MFMRAPRVAIIGATGAVGRVALQVLEERDFPMEALRLCASPRSVGKRIAFKGEEIEIEAVDEALLAECDIAFVSATDAVSRELGPLAARLGCVVIDDSAVFRMEQHVPLVIPEVNAWEIERHKGIISIPNCSTTQLVMALWPLNRFPVSMKRVIVDTYQSVSGTGGAAMAELWQQTDQVLRGEPPTITQYPYQIAFNLLPHIGSLNEDGSYSDEVKMRQETQKIMRSPGLAVSATCVRIPVPLCHSEAVHVEFGGPVSPEVVRRVLSESPGVTVVDHPEVQEYPMPISCAGKDEVFVGRIRQDASQPQWLSLWVVSDNLRKGAATNAVQIAEELVSRGALLR